MSGSMPCASRWPGVVRRAQGGLRDCDSAGHRRRSPRLPRSAWRLCFRKADQAAKVVAIGNGKLGLEIDGKVIKDRKDRVAFLKEHAGVSVFDAKLDDLLPKPSKKVRDGIARRRLVLITSQEIDELCEQDNITQARRQMDGVLNDLRRGFRVLADLGVKHIVLAADHGHLFGDEISEDMKIEAPGGETADLHRRVWVGEGGTSEPSYLRTSLASLGMRERLRHRHPLDVRLLQVEGRREGLLPRRAVAAGIDHPGRGDDPDGPGVAGPPTGIEWTLTPGTAKN